jgi:cobalt-zinc-cadmium efflux system outer membrane protein
MSSVPFQCRPIYFAALAVCLFTFFALPSWAGEFSKSSELSLPDAINLAIANNPELASYRHQISACDAEKRIALRLPNPTAEMSADEIGGKSDARASFWIKQPLLINGQRDSEISAASYREEKSLQEALSKEREILYRVKNSFYKVLLAQQRARLAEESLGLAQEVQRVAKLRYQAQASSEMDLLRSEVEVEASRIQAENARKNIQLAQFELMKGIGKEAMNCPSLTPFEPPTPAPLDSLLSRLPAENPSLRAAAANRRAAEAEGKGKLSNPEVGLGLVRRIELGDNLLSASIGWPLPFFGINEENERGQALVEKAKAEEASMKNEILLSLRQGYAEYQSFLKTTKLYREKMIPTSEEAFKRMSLSYRYGRVSYLDLLESRRRLIETKSSLFDARERLAEAAFRIESLFFDKETLR